MVRGIALLTISLLLCIAVGVVALGNNHHHHQLQRQELTASLDQFLGQLDVDVDKLLSSTQRLLTKKFLPRDHEEEDDDDEEFMDGWSVTLAGLTEMNKIALINVALESSGETRIYLTAPSSEPIVITAIKTEGENLFELEVTVQFEDEPFVITHNAYAGPEPKAMQVSLRNLNIKSLAMVYTPKPTGKVVYLNCYSLLDLSLTFRQGRDISIAWQSMALYVPTGRVTTAEEMTNMEANALLLGTPKMNMIEYEGAHYHEFRIKDSYLTFSGFLIGAAPYGIDIKFSIHGVRLDKPVPPQTIGDCTEYDNLKVGEKNTRVRINNIKNNAGYTEDFPSGLLDYFNLKTGLTSLAMQVSTVKNKVCSNINVLGLFFNFVGELPRQRQARVQVPITEVTRRSVAFANTGITHVSINGGRLTAKASFSAIGMTVQSHPLPAKVWLPFPPVRDFVWGEGVRNHLDSPDGPYETYEIVDPIDPSITSTMRMVFTVADDLATGATIATFGVEEENVVMPIKYTKHDSRLGDLHEHVSFSEIVKVQYHDTSSVIRISHSNNKDYTIPSTTTVVPSRHEMRVTLPVGFQVDFGATFFSKIGRLRITTPKDRSLYLHIIRDRNDAKQDIPGGKAELDVAGMVAQSLDHELKLEVLGLKNTAWLFRPGTSDVREGTFHRILPIIHNSTTFEDTFPQEGVPPKYGRCSQLAADGPTLKVNTDSTDVLTWSRLVLAPTVEALLVGWMTFALKWVVGKSLGDMSEVGNANDIICFVLAKYMYTAM